MLKIGSHVGMSGKEMFLGSVREAVGYGGNTFMLYTGAPQNSKRKPIEELNIQAGWDCMKENHMEDFVVHAPYTINLGNGVKPETFQFAVSFLREEIRRTEAMGGKILVLHPGAHVGAGADKGIQQVIKGLNEVLTKETKVLIALETMAGKGTEIGGTFEELRSIFDGVQHNQLLRVCFDTCHTHDHGYAVAADFDSVINEFDKILGKEQIAVFHVNDSKNVIGVRKDRHENIGFGEIGFDALHHIVMNKDFENVPKILETPYIRSEQYDKKSYAPYGYEIDMLKKGVFCPELKETIIKDNEEEA